MYKRKKKLVPRSDLRTRLDEYTTWKDESSWFLTEGKEREGFLQGILAATSFKNMHRFLLIKIVAICCIILVVYFLNFLQLPFSFALSDKIHYLTTWNMDFKGMGQQVLPVVRLMWEGNIEEGLGHKVMAPKGVIQHTEEVGGEKPLFLSPVEGELEKTFGLQYNPLLQQEVMFYGLLFRPGQGEYVRAAADGVVQKIGESSDFGPGLSLKHQLEMETYYGCLAEVLVEEGETVSRGQNIGVVGFNPKEGKAVLYFELRQKGRPLNPLPLLVGSQNE
jgi:murein DD-endopeptidase MepM/ murein hydrolase activator NlpD